MPVGTGEAFQRAFRARAKAEAAERHHEVRHAGVGEPGDVAEQGVEDVRLLQIIELVGAAVELPAAKRRSLRVWKKTSSGTRPAGASLQRPVELGGVRSGDRKSVVSGQSG